MKTILQNIHFVFFISIFLFVSCEADIDLKNIDSTVNYQQTVLIPLGTVKANLFNLIEKYDTKNNFYPDLSTGINYTYEDSTEFSYATLDLLSEVNYIKKYPLDESGNFKTFLNPRDSINLLKKDSIYLNLNENTFKQRIDSIKFSKLNLNFVLSNNGNSIPVEDVQIILNFPKDRMKFLNSGSTNRIVIVPQTYGLVNTIQLKNFVLYLKNKTDYLPFEIQINIKNKGTTPINLALGTSFLVNIKPSLKDFVAVYGYVNPDIVESQVFSRKVDLFKLMPNSQLKIYNPQFQISTNSNLGAHLKLKVDYIKVFSSTNTGFTPVFAWFDNHTTNSMVEILKNRAKNPGEWATNTLKTFDRNWGETNGFFEQQSKPDMLEFKFTASVDNEIVDKDPVGNFIVPDTRLKMKIKSTIPLIFDCLSFYEYETTVTNNLNSLNDPTNSIPELSLDSIYLILKIKNSLPVSASLNVRFMNEKNEQIVTGFKESYTIESGLVNALGMVEKGNESNQLLKIMLSREQYNIIKTTSKVAFKIILNGSDLNSKIQFTSNDFVEIQTGIKLCGNLNSKITL